MGCCGVLDALMQRAEKGGSYAVDVRLRWPMTVYDLMTPDIVELLLSMAGPKLRHLQRRRVERGLAAAWLASISPLPCDATPNSGDAEAAACP